jgi:radical SAM superfamily enzyme YgiQ (UPF0313 family)
MIDRTGQGGFRVALVGRRLSDNENLGLGYLRAALHAAGFAVETHVLNSAADVVRIGAELLGRPPGLVGLSLADGGSAFLPLALGELLRARGFSGHITCGGPFATLARRWLLERYVWLGSVVRFAGEVPLCALAARLTAGHPVHDVPGVTTREGDGPPAPVTDDAPLRLRPERDELPEILGHRAAHVSATRGCRGRCLYCGPAALQLQEREEGRRAGVPSEELERCGVGGVRRRSLDELCDEMAELWHDRGVRYFYFVDEHLLPYEEREALDFLDGWRRGLRRRRVGRLGLGGMLRADRLTPAVARAFAEAGLVRVFLGLEFATAEEARRYGRRAPGPAELELVRRFAELGVVTVSNLMLVHPDSTPETIAAGIDLLARIPAGSFEATRMMAYHGTRLHERLEREGRLTGNPLRWGYRIDDPVVDRFSRLFSRLRGEVFWDYSIGYRTHDAHLAFALQRRLSGRAPEELAQRIERVRAAVNALYVEAYREAFALSRSAVESAGVEPLLARMRSRAERLEMELERLEARLLAGRPGARLLAPMRAAAAGAISFCILASSPSCCRCPDRPAGTVPHEGPAVVVVGGDAAEPREAVAAGGDAGATEPVADVESEAGEVLAPTPSECTPERQAVAGEALRKRVGEADSCFSGSVLVMEATPEARQTLEQDEPTWPFAGAAWRIHDDGRVYVYQFEVSDYFDGFGFRICDPADAGRKNEERVAAALAGESFPCAGGPNEVAVAIQGGADQDMERLRRQAGRCGQFSHFGGEDLQVVLDGSGAVTDVRGGGGEDATELRRCVREALHDLVFPCLADFELCPEYVIIE